MGRLNKYWIHIKNRTKYVLSWCKREMGEEYAYGDYHGR